MPYLLHFYIFSKPYTIFPKRELFRLTETTVHARDWVTDKDYEKINIGPRGELYEINNGKWFYVVLIFNAKAKLIEVYINTVLVSEIRGFGSGDKLPPL